MAKPGLKTKIFNEMCEKTSKILMFDICDRSDGWKIILDWGVFKVENLGVFHFDSTSCFERLENLKI